MNNIENYREDNSIIIDKLNYPELECLIKKVYDICDNLKIPISVSDFRTSNEVSFKRYPSVIDQHTII